MKAIQLLIIPAVSLVACDSQNHKQSSDDIAGTYVMEKTYEVRHEATGEPVGMATLRDTIIITKISDGYEVKNRKWKKNEFDEEGWVKQEHGSSPSYNAKFEESTHTLNSQVFGMFAPIEIDRSRNVLIRGKSRIEYTKV